MAYTDNSLMSFGLHKGKKLANVPAHYLLWIYKVNCNNECHARSNELCKYIHENLDSLKLETNQKK